MNEGTVGAFIASLRNRSHTTSTMPIQKSVLITRRTLASVSGGQGGKNTLKLATPISFYGGAAIATKDKKVAHITIKEAQNVPLPKDSSENFVLWRIGDADKETPRDFNCIAETNDKGQLVHKQGIPIFWEPASQKKNETKVQYCGHWKVIEVKVKKEQIMDRGRCGKITFRFDRYDESFDRIISEAASKDEAEASSKAKDSGKQSSTTTRSVAKKRDRGAAEETEQKKASTRKRRKVSTTVKQKASTTKKRKASTVRTGVASTPTSSVGSRTTAVIEPKTASRTKRSPSKRNRDRNVVEDANKRSKASTTQSASASTAAAIDDEESRKLEEYDANQVSKLVSRKGTAFEPLAKLFKDADFKGTRIVEQLKKGDKHFLKFLEQTCGMDSPLHCLSVLGTFKDAIEGNVN